MENIEKRNEDQPEKETIRNAAVLFRGKIFEGATHGHALGALLEHLKTEDPALYKKTGGDEYALVEELERLSPDLGFEGFVTSEGRFISRKEARGIARIARQTGASSDGDLHAEDLAD